MPPEKSTGNPMALAGGLLAFLFAVAIGWFMFGGWKNADLAGYFTAPPSAPRVLVPGDGSVIIQGSDASPATYPNATSAPRL